MKTGNILIISIAILLGLSGCKKSIKDNTDPNNEVENMNDLKVPEGFTYETNKQVHFNIKMPNTINFTDYRGRFILYSDDPEQGGKQLQSGTFNQSGEFSDVLAAPQTFNKLFLKTAVMDSLIKLSDDFIEEEFVTIDLSEYYGNDTIIPDSLKYLADGNFFKYGAGQTRFEALVNADFEIDDFDTVWVRNQFHPDHQGWNFAIEGLGNTPMTWFNENGNGFVGTTYAGTHQFAINQTFMVNPGDLISFTANVQPQVENGMQMFFWVTAYNGNGNIVAHASSPQLQFPPLGVWTTQTVMLTMPANAGYCVVTATGGDWTPLGRIICDNFSAGGITDSDGDGVENEFDEYPNDPERAYNQYFPNDTDYGTFAFEDNWPNRGDYDFNDLVVDYQYKQVLNANNEMVDLEIDFRFMASGAGYDNGFGFQMDLSPELVASVTGNSLEEGFVNTNANGTESGQDKTTIIITDNVFNVLIHPGGGTGINTNPDLPFVEPVSLIVLVEFTEPVTVDQTGYAPYNPFMIVNKIRGKEVHLPGYPPTSLVDESYFGTGEDDTNLALGKYYLTKNNLPWGINLPISFDYPVEGSKIIDAYIHFAQWAQSQGFSFMDWYMEKNGYRNLQNIYSE